MRGRSNEKRYMFFEQLEKRELLSSISFYIPDAVGADYVTVKGALVMDLDGYVVQNKSIINGIGKIQGNGKSVVIKVKNGGDGILDLSQTNINLGSASKVSISSDIIGGNFNFGDLGSFSVKGDIIEGDFNFDSIDRFSVKGIFNGNLNVSGILGSFNANTLIGRINSGEIKKVTLREVSDSIISAEKYLGDVKVIGGVHNADIVSGVEPVDEIYGNVDDISKAGVRRSIGSVRIGRYGADSTHGILGVGDFKAVINGQRFISGVSPMNFGEGVVKSLLPLFPRPAIPPENLDYTFTVFGDPQSKTNRNIIDLIVGANPDFNIIVGDINEKSSDKSYARFSEIAAPLFNSTKVYGVVGNHDIKANPKPEDADLLRWINYWDNPGNEVFYSFESAGIEHFIVNSRGGTMPGTEQYEWLKNALVFSTADFKFVYMHHPPVSSAASSSKSVKENFIPLFEEYGVDIVFAGHAHGYQHNRLNGIEYIVTAGGGGSLRGASVKDFTVLTEKTYNFVNVFVDLDNNQIGIQTIRDDGSELESFVLSKD